MPLLRSASATIRSPALKRPWRRARASEFSTRRWIVRLSGLAPNAGSCPSRAIRARAAGVSSRARSWPASRRARSARSRSTIAAELGVGQGMEHDDLVDPVQELRPEPVVERLVQAGLHRLVVRLLVTTGRGDQVAADVAGHDHQGVPEVDRPALAIGQAAVVEDLEQDVEHVRMGFLDLVQQDDLVRPAADGLGQLAALLVADVARRRPDEPADGELLHVLAHVDPDHGAVVIEQEPGQGPGQLGLAHPGRAEEQERADRAIRVAQARPGPPDGIGHGFDRLVLADDPFVQALLHVDELGRLALEQLRHRHAGPGGHDLGNIVGVDLLLEHPARPIERGDRRLLGPEALLELDQGAVLELGCPAVVGLPLDLLDLRLEGLELGLRGPDRPDRILLGLPALLHPAGALLDLAQLALEDLEAGLRGVVLLLAQGLPLDLELDRPALELVELDRHRVDLHPEPAGRLVDEVDRLVRQEPVGDIAVGHRGRRDEGRIGDPDPVVDLVALAQAAQDRDRLLDAGLVHDDRLEATLEGGVLLDVLAVLVESRRPDRVQLAPGEHRLEQVAGVHRAFGRARPDDRVELVDEEDDPALGILDVLQDGLEPLLELAPELRPGDQRPEVERDDLLVAERLGHVAPDDPLGQAFDDRRLAHAGLADQDRVVLGPPAQDLDHPPDLVVAADDRIELARAGLGRQVPAVLLEGLVGRFGVGRGDPLAAPDALEGTEDRFPAGAVTFEERLGLATRLGHAEQEVLGRDVLVGHPAGLFLGPLDHPPGPRVEADLAAPDAGPPSQDAGQLVAEAGQVDAEPPEGLGRHAVVRLQQAGQEVLGIEDRALERRGALLGGDDRLLGFLGESVELHVGYSLGTGDPRIRLIDEVEE